MEHLASLKKQGFLTVDQVKLFDWSLIKMLGLFQVMSINIEDLEELGIGKLGHQKRLMLGIKKAKLSRRRTTNFEEQAPQGISRSQFEGLKGMSSTKNRDVASKIDSTPTLSPRFHLRSTSLSVPFILPPLSEREKAFSPRTSPCSPKAIPERPSSKPPAPPMASCQQEAQPSIGKVKAMKLQAASKITLAEFFEQDRNENLKNKARLSQRTPSEGPDKLTSCNEILSKSEALGSSGFMVSEPVLWSTTLGNKQRKMGKTPEKSEDLELDVKTSHANHSIKMPKSKKADVKEGTASGLSKKFWNMPSQQWTGKCNASKPPAHKIKEEPKTNLRALVQNYGDWVKERGMVDLHRKKERQESSGGCEDSDPKTFPTKMQPQVVVSHPKPAKEREDRYGSEAWKDPPMLDSREHIESHQIFSCDNSTGESLLTPPEDHLHQNGLQLFQRLRDTTRPLSWVTEQHPSGPDAPPSPPPHSHLVANDDRLKPPEEQASDESRIKSQPTRPVARVAALHVVTNQTSTFLQPLPATVPQEHQKQNYE